MTFFVLFLSFWFVANISTTFADMQLHLAAANTPGSKCLDGSPAGMYYEAPQFGASDLWVIYLAGGGACFSQPSCAQRANSSLGSSTFWSKTKKGTGALSTSAASNPDFYAGHHVFVPYCTGDVHSGQRTEASAQTWGYYFDGHLVFKAVIHALAANAAQFGLLSAKYILLSGGSAGGLGTFVNLDFMASELKSLGISADVYIRGAPVAGWFFAGNTTDQPSQPMMPPNDYPHWVQSTDGGEGHDDSANVLWDSYLNPVCVHALGPSPSANASWHCGSVHNLYRFIQTPMFVMQNKYDTNQIHAQFLMPKNVVNENTTAYVEYFGADSDRSILGQMVNSNTVNGLFYASCFDHGGGLGIGSSAKTKIGEYNSSQLVGDWFWQRNKYPHIVYDTCNTASNQLPCNPSCDSYGGGNGS